MTAYPGPTGNLKPRQKRSGRSGTTWEGPNMLGEVVAIEWNVEVEQIPVQQAGQWQDGSKPGAEARRGTFRIQDVDDRWALRVYRFLKARREGNREVAAQFPTFDLITQIDDVGAPAPTRWAIRGCELYGYAKGYGNDDNLLMRDIAFSFEDDEPLDAYEYTEGGVAIYDYG